MDEWIEGSSLIDKGLIRDNVKVGEWSGEERRIESEADWIAGVKERGVWVESEEINWSGDRFD